MEFKVKIPADKFSKNQLKVVSMTPVLVNVYDKLGIIQEEFETKSSQTIYPLQTSLDEIGQVIVDIIPGKIYDFYPVVQAY
ncbi:hypothetical protein [Granulicatella seriolae]|jgi:hypothetical protein|uniref:Uncharacterized protein n=1 Tax=Granulicatella seriolae TaxID=2967226 RepID=A0ABT1WL50_9LACT|nr:hypothetical protein [Granulicatella seriolae]